METPELTSADYWESDAVDIRLDSRRGIDASGLREFLVGPCALDSAVVLATSGSSGDAESGDAESGDFKFVVLAKAALLASARSVVAHCGLSRDDVWLAGLSDFHVGGLGIAARAYLTGGRVERMPPGRWRRDGGLLLEGIRKAGATVTSVTPTHLHDVVANEAEAPSSLRGVFTGGGRLEPELAARARELGWPVWASYGMTEAGSQIATSLEQEAEWLPLLPIWETRVEADGRLAIRGEALFSGYAVKDGAGCWRFEAGKTDGGWFVTGDRCAIEEGRLRFLGRADDLVKVSGELVSVSKVEQRASWLARRKGRDAGVATAADPRRGNELILVVQGSETEAAALLEELNRGLDGIERVSRVVRVAELPRTAIGKIDRRALNELARP